MSVKASASALVQAMKDLNFQWEETKSFWNDIKAREFERKFVGEIPGEVSRAVTVMEELENLLKKVRSDCE